MRKTFSISSQETNDRLLEVYSSHISLLGYENGNIAISGLYDRLDLSGVSYMSSASGIPHCGTAQGTYLVGFEYDKSSSVLIDMLIFDYIYRKSIGEI